MSKGLNQLSSNNLRIKVLFRWRFSSKLSFRIFWLERFTNKELSIFCIWGCTSSHRTERRPVRAFKSLSYCLLWRLPSVSPAKWVLDKAPPCLRKWVNSINQETDAESGTDHSGMFGVVVLIWISMWKLLMLVVKNKNKLLIINIGMETGSVFGPNPNTGFSGVHGIANSLLSLQPVIQLHKVFFKILAQTVCWA